MQQGRNHHDHTNSETDCGKTSSPPTDREESNELEADLRRMGCLGLWEKSSRVRSEDVSFSTTYLQSGKTL